MASWQSTVLGDGPQNYFRLNELSGTVATDAMGHANATIHPAFAATATGALTASGDSDAAITLNGTTQWINFPRQVQDDFTLVCLFKTTGGIGTNLGHWYSAAGLIGADVPGFVKDFGCSIDKDGFVYIGTGGPDAFEKSTDNGWNNGAWHLLHYVRTRLNGQVLLYLDGELQAVLDSSTASLTAPANIAIGSIEGSNGVRLLAATFDEVLTYTYGLTQAQVSAHYLSAFTPAVTGGGAVPVVRAPVGVAGLWTYVVTDLAGNNIGQLDQATPRRLSPTMSNVDTASLTVRGDNALIGQLINGQARLKIYDGSGQLRFHGSIATMNPQGGTDTQQLDIVCASPLLDLNERFIGKSATGVSYGTPAIPVDRTVIAKQIIDSLNAEADTGIRVGNLTPTSTTYTGLFNFKPALEALTELATAVDGYEYRLLPSEPVKDALGTQIAVFTAAAALGQARPDLVFEYGFGNCYAETLQAPWTRMNQANRWFSLPQNFPSNGAQAVLSAEDTDSQKTWGLREGIIPGDVTSDDLRLKLAVEYKRIRSQPQQTIQFVPSLDAPQFYRDFDIGDVIRLRARFGGPTAPLWIDALLRVFGADIDITDAGEARVSPKLVYDPSAVSI